MYNFSVALCYLTLHQIIQKLEKLVFLLKCVARWFLNLDTRFNWAPPSVLYYSTGSLHSPEPRWILCKHWRRIWGREGESLFSSLPTAAPNMAHRGGKERNKDELSALKISHRAEAAHTPQPVCEFSKEKEALPPSIYLFINIDRVIVSVVYPWTSGALAKSHVAFWVVHIISCASEAITLHLLAPSTPSTGQRCENAIDTLITSSSWGNVGSLNWRFLDQPSFGWNSPCFILSCNCFHILRIICLWWLIPILKT